MRERLTFSTLLTIENGEFLKNLSRRTRKNSHRVSALLPLLHCFLGQPSSFKNQLLSKKE
jgi:hypothetical protein